MKCECGQCENKPEIPLKWQGEVSHNVVVVGDTGLPVHVATLSIQAIPLLVEPWMIESALRVAARVLSKNIANYSFGKIVN